THPATSAPYTLSLHDALPISGLEERVDDRVLRDQFVADGVADGLREAVAVARYHALRPDGEAEDFDGAVRPEEHAHGEPSRAVADRKSTRLNSSHSQISYAVF